MMQYITTSATQGICPDVWLTIPYQEEWDILFSYYGGYEVAGGRMKSTGIIEEGTGLWKYPNRGATNSEGLTDHPAGYYREKYYELGYGTRFWVSEAFMTTEAIFQSLWFLDISVFGYYTNRSDGLSVRCLKDN